MYFRTARPMAQDEEFVSSFRRPLKEVPSSNRGKGLEGVEVEPYFLNILNSSCVSDRFLVGVCHLLCTNPSLSNAFLEPFWIREAPVMF